MNSRVSWSVDGIDPSVRERAEAAARRAGMSLNDWLNSTIGESAPPNFRAPYEPARRRCRARKAATSPTFTSGSIPSPGRSSRFRGPRRAAKPARRSRPRRAGRGPPAQRRHFAPRRAAVADFEPGAARQAQMQDKQRQAEMVERAAAQVYRPSPPLSPASIDFAIAEIAARQNELDGPPPRQMPPRTRRRRHSRADGATPAMPPSRDAGAPAGPDFSSLERHLLKITSQIEALQRPDHVEQSIAAFRSELAEIRHAITEAMPRRAIEFDRERNPLAVAPHRRHPPERHRRPDAGRHRARARRNPRSAALADAGRAARRLRRGDPQSRRQARPDPALERRSRRRCSSSKARSRRFAPSSPTSPPTTRWRGLPTTCTRCRPRSTSCPRSERQQRFLRHARAAHRRADLDAGKPASGRPPATIRNFSKARCARCRNGSTASRSATTTRRHSPISNSACPICWSAWKPPTDRPLAAVDLGRVEEGLQDILRSSRTPARQSGRARRQQPQASRRAAADGLRHRRPRQARIVRHPLQPVGNRPPHPGIRSRPFTARSAMWSIACR